MKSNINLYQNDFEELIQDGRIELEGNYGNPDDIRKDNVLGYISHQSIITPKYKIEDSKNIFYKDVNFSTFLNSTIFYMQFHFGGAFEFDFRNKRLSVEGNTNNVGVLNPEQTGNASFRENVNFDSIEICIPDNTLEELANQYPDLLGNALYNYKKGKSYLLKEQYQPTTIEMIHIISQIKNAKLMGNTSDIYIEAKVLELLSLQLQQNGTYLDNNYQNQCKTFDEIEKIHEARRILLADLSQSPTISELSKCVGINECKLKYGFKKVYNQTVFGSLFDHKMDLAHKLLLDTNKTIVEIAYDCGYGQASHFITAFKKKYGFTPKGFRDKA